jgi:YVTN family beta-propeller protein
MFSETPIARKMIIVSLVVSMFLLPGLVSVTLTTSVAATSVTNTSVFVEDHLDHAVSVIAPQTGTVTSVNVGSLPEYQMTYAPNIEEVVATNLGGNSISLIRPDTGKVSKVLKGFDAPSAALYVSTNKDVYVSNQGSGIVSAIDTSTDKVVANITVKGTPWYLGFNPINNDLYVSNQGTQSVDVISTATNALVANVSVSGIPYGVEYNPSNMETYVAVEASSGGHAAWLTVISGTNSIVTTVNYGGLQPGGEIAYDSANSYLYVADQVSHVVYVLNSTNSIVGTVGGFRVAFGAVYDPTNQKVYVSDITAYTVTTISGLTAGTVYNVLGGPSGLATNSSTLVY